MFLAAALIVRDEVDRLRRCLESVAGVVDEIVVVDTGSSDDSVAVASAFGADVLSRPWDGDFSAARNFGLDHVRSDWVLYLDADEYLRDATRAAVVARLRDPERHVAYRIRLRSQAGFTPYFEYRIWRNRDDIRFWGVIHETVVPSIRRVADAEGLAVGEAELLLEHDGYEGDQTAKHRRNLPLLLRQVELDPQRTYLWDHIGRIRAALGEYDLARSAWSKGIDLVRRHGARQPADCLVYLDLIVAEAGSGRPDPALVAEADHLFPSNPLILWAGVLDAAARGAHEEVVDRVGRLLAAGTEEAARLALGVNERIGGEWAYHARGMALFHLGDPAAAARDFAAAAAAAPGVAEYRVKHMLAEARAARHGGPFPLPVRWASQGSKMNAGMC